MQRVYNFSADAASLPDEVILKIKNEMLCYGDSGASVMELSHREEAFESIRSRTEELVRELLDVPDNYEVLFLGGGATTQFSAVALNLLKDSKKADYVLTGLFSKKAAMEAKKYGDIAIAASSAGAIPVYHTVPKLSKQDFRQDADYVHLCYNNTVYGTCFNYIPDTDGIPIVADMSSSLFSAPIPISRFGVIYASCQQSIAASGLTVVIVRNDLIGNAKADTPTVLDYKPIADSDSMYNTPPCFAIYTAGCVLEWMRSLGGMDKIYEANLAKSELLYGYLDSQSYYTAPADKKYRSLTTAVFVTGSAALDRKFIFEAKAEGFVNLEGHTSVGGMRAAIGTTVSYEAVSRLVDFMKTFRENNPKSFE
jgi:phosphoserine aminotransferase